MEDTQHWDQVAIMTKEIDGRKLTATVVSSKENRFEVIPTMEESRIVITVPLAMIVDIGNHIRSNLKDEEVEKINQIAQRLREKHPHKPSLAIGEFVRNHHEIMDKLTFAPMGVLMDRCKLLFEDHFNLPEGDD